MRNFQQFRLSSIALLLTNIVPLLGIWLWGWDVFSILLLYWLENVVIGGINVLKMIVSSPADDNLRNIYHVSKLFFIPFFIVHYGMFCFVHGMFVFSIFGKNRLDVEAGTGATGLIQTVMSLFGTPLALAMFGLAASHLVSFFRNYLGHGEYRSLSVQQLMGQPYARIVVLHLTILAGAFAAAAMGDPSVVIAVLVAVKTIVDLKFHLRERRKAAEKFVRKEENQ